MDDLEERVAPRDYWALWSAAFLLRLAWTAWTGQFHPIWRSDNRYDDGAYMDMAMAFLGLGPQGPLTHPPGYAFYLMPFALFGDAGMPAMITVQLALGACAAPMTCGMARRLGLGARASLWAGALTIVDPLLIYFGSRMLAETLFLFLALGCMLCWLRAWEEDSFGAAALSGLLGGLASLTRGVMLPYGGVLALAAFWRRRQQPRWAALVAVCGLCWAAAISPWTARNWLKYRRFVAISAQGGWNFYEGLTLDPDEIYSKRPKAMGEEAAALGLRDPFEVNAYFDRKAKTWVRQHPGGFLWLSVRKAFKFWRPFPYPPHSRAIIWSVGLFNLALMGLAAAGLALGAAASPSFCFLAGWAAQLTALHSLFASNLRYRLPLEPVIALAAGAGLSALLGILQKR